MPAAPLPAPRRVIASHTPSGEAHVIDETVPHASDAETLKAYVGFVQPEPVGRPDKAVEWAETKYENISNDDKISLKWIDIPPKTEAWIHYTNTFDYLIITHGELEMVLHDGSSKTIKTGDAVVQIANIHGWANKTDQWARFVGVVVPSNPTIVNGQTLDQPPFNAHLAHFTKL